ncbi:MAG: M20/M25/M40 family metallo-hydrolase [Acidobacteriota bacterium]
MRSRQPTAGAIFTALLLVTGAAGSLWLSGPPTASGPVEDTVEFSTPRAMAHVEEIAQQPHPTGSAEHARVREYLVRTLQAMLLPVEHQRTTVARIFTRGGAAGPIRAARVHNLLTRIRGTDSTGAVLLASHYDSVPAAPGAADAASCVAAILEAARALREGQPLRNDVIVLLTDGEEDGLLGAAAFVEQHPWARDVRLVLNFEARGTGGPSQMFETSTGNGRIVDEWAHHIPFATGSSLGYEIYKRLPNDTDFTMFKQLNAEGLNFAFIDNVEAYHTPADAPVSLARASLQAHGTTALALVRRFGAIDLDALDARDAVFFSMPLGYAVSYSTLWVLPLAGLLLAAWVVTFVFLRRRGATSAGGTILAAIITAAIAAGAVFAGLRYQRFPVWLHDRWLGEAAVTTNAAYAFSLVCALAGAWLAIQALLRRAFAPHTLALGASFVWLLAAGAAAWWLPGASYVVFWPVVAAVIATAVLSPDTTKRARSLPATLALWVLAVPTLAIVVPTAASLFAAVGTGREGGAAIAACTILALGTLVPQVELVTEGRRWWPAVVAFLAGVGALVAGAWTAPYGPAHPRPVNMVYVLDADTATARWASSAADMHPWLEQYLTRTPARGPLSVLASARASADYWQHDAPALPLAPPEATVIDDTAAAGDRLVTLRVVSPRHGRTLSLRIPDAAVVDTWIGGVRAGGNRGGPGWEQGRWSLDYIDPPESGLVLQLRIKGRLPVTMALVDRTHGLPEVPGRELDPRPPALTTIQNGDVTVVSRTIRF